MRLARWTSILVAALVAVTTIAAPAAPAAAKKKAPAVCAKQKHALKKAKSKKAKARAKKSLAKCQAAAKKKHAAPLKPTATPVKPATGPQPVSIDPATPFVDDFVEVDIRPAAALEPGNVYRVVLKALGGEAGDGDSHLVSFDTDIQSVEIGPEDDQDGGSEWAAGKAVVEVTVVPAGSPPGTAGAVVGAASFVFSAHA